METQDNGNPVINPEQNTLDTKPVTQDPVATLLAEIKDESGRQKYTSPESGIKALKDSQEFIQQQKAEIQALKQQLGLSKDIQDLKEYVMDTDSQKQVTDSPELPVDTTTEDSNSEQQPDLETQFKSFLEKERAETAKQTNKTEVQNKLSGMFGDKTEELYAAKAAELGVSTAFLDSLSEQSPTAVLSYFQQAPKDTGITSTVNLANRQSPDIEVKSVMHGASSADVLAAFRACDTK